MSEADPAPHETWLRWEQVLDEFEACLAEQERQLDEDPAADLVAFTPPTDLGPMPLEVSERAGRLLLRAGQLGDRVAAQLGGAGRQLALANRMAGTRAGRTAYVDRMA
ncbi:hypothetical protein [Oryzihumus sp.]|jgi:hypothetical protein|uniref:hypothetical protein n=1 Tax=Oryzihumus sp. TaxID=1968903 RepID=UPI002EDB99A0